MTSETSAGTAADAADAATAPPPPSPAKPDPNGLVNNAVYVHGKRIETPHTVTATFGVLEKHPTGFAWIGLYRPDAESLGVLASQFGLHELAVEDAVNAHQRPKLERYGDTLFMVLKAARYNDSDERVEFGELNVFAGPNFVITVRHAESPDLSIVRSRLEATPDALEAGPEAVLYAILDAVVDEYAPVVTGLGIDIDEIETQVFGGDPAVSRRIYQLNREVIAFERAVKPLPGIIQMFSSGFADGHVEEKLQQYLRDVSDHVEKAFERIEEYRVLLRDILAVNTSLVAQRQTEEAQRLSETSNEQAVQTRKISGWAAILFAPSLIGAIYGMNFRFMPELNWPLGYPFALTLMAASSVILYVVFKRKGWL